jgi:protein phosphatase
VRLEVGRATDTGQLRGNNEDAFLVDNAHGLFAVADGMGGHVGGEVASRTAIEGLRAAFASGANIEDAIGRANDAVINRAANDEQLTGMGTTLTAVTIGGPGALLFGHVGDSRAYLLHDGTLSRVTDDHSLVEELVRDGRLTPEQAESHPQRAIITRVLGNDPDVQVDLYPVTVQNGDRVIICSDGLTTMVRERDVERIARTERDPQHAADAMVAAANEAGGDDNITVIVIDVLESDAESAAPVDTSAPAPAPAPAPIAARPADVEERPGVTQPPKPRRRPVRTFLRALVVIIPILLILGVGVGALGWYARGSYYVGTAGNEVVIYKGVPGGVLGWNPTIDSRTGIKVNQLSPVDAEHVGSKTARGSRATAEAYVERLRDSIAATSTTTTTIKRKPRTTTTVKRRPRTTTTIRKRT